MKRFILAMMLLIVPLAVHAKPKPNIVLIFTDDAGYADISAFGQGRGLLTPEIDRIAENGAMFSSGYVAASVCAPSRAGLLTGRYQQRYGFHLNLPVAGTIPSNDPDLEGLPVDELTIGDLLQAQGYRTAIIGKWHQGVREQFRPLVRGFDYFYGFLAGSRSYWLEDPARDLGQRMMRNTDFIYPTGYMTEVLTDEAIGFMSQESDQPFFVYLSHFAPHAPMQPKPEDEALFSHIEDPKRRALAGMSLSMDREIGRVLDFLEETGLDQNTLVIFLNDNGGPTYQNASDNTPLRGMKGSEFEGGIRVAYMMQWPGVIPAGTVYDHPVIAYDVVPTAVAVAGGELPDDREFDGVNLMPYVTGEIAEPPHKQLFWKRAASSTVRRGDWKLMNDDTQPRLFNLREDLSETENLADRYPEKVRELQAAIADWETIHTPRLWDTGWTVGR